MLSSGIDVVSIKRIERASMRPGFLERVYSSDELRECSGEKRPERYLACRFALKEAVIKALGAERRAGVRMREVEVLKGPDGADVLRLGPGVQKFLKGRRAFLSSTSAGDLALAVAIID